MSSPRLVPFSLATDRDDLGRPAELIWPTHPDTIAATISQMLTGYFETLRTCKPEDRQVLLLGGYLAFVRAISAIETALNLERSKELGVRLYDNSILFRFLNGETKFQASWCGILPGTANIRRPRFAALRRARANINLSGWPRLSGFRDTDAIAISTNSLLIASARTATSRVSFEHMGAFLDAALGDKPPVMGGEEKLAAHLTDRVLSAVSLTSPYTERVASWLHEEASRLISAARWQLDRVSRLEQLPRYLWSGTGGNYASRLIGQAVISSGGRIRRFSHGGLSAALSTEPRPFTLTELSVCSEYVVPTTKLRDLVASGPATADLPGETVPKILAGPGDPEFKPVSLGKPRSGRRTVMYVPTLLRGHHQYLVPDPSDLVNLDWQLRLATIVRDLQVDLICKPHPAGTLGGARHPLEDIANTTYRRFEDVISEADVFLLDIATSYTFWKAISTDRPVVLANINPIRFNPTVRSLLERRCRIVPVHYDSNNLPQVDKEMLSDAICGGNDRADPSELWALFAPTNGVVQPAR